MILPITEPIRRSSALCKTTIQKATYRVQPTLKIQGAQQHKKQEEKPTEKPLGIYNEKGKIQN
jgi:hypothetical protein